MAIMANMPKAAFAAVLIVDLMAYAVTASATPVTGTMAIINAKPNSFETVRGRVIIGGFLGAPYSYGGAPYPPYYYSGRDYNYNRRLDDAARNCRQQYGSFNPYSGTYVGPDGFTHPCPP